MALVVYWYDFVCFGIVVASFVGSLWVLWRKELAAKGKENSNYESLIVPRRDDEENPLPTNHVGGSQLWISCWKGMHPVWLLFTRLVSFLVMSCFLSWDIIDWDYIIFVYYTEWTFTLVMVYFALATMESAYGCWKCLTQPSSGEETLVKRDLEENGPDKGLPSYERDFQIRLRSLYAAEAVRHRAGFWGYLMQAIYQTCAGAVILTDIVFWCIIVPFGTNSHLHLDVLMGCMHTLNAIFLLIDTALNSLPFPWFRFAYFVQWSCLYVVFQWILHACGLSWWPYPFLSLGEPWAPLWYFAMAILHIPCYGLYALIVNAKNTVLPRLFPDAFLSTS